MASGNCNNGHSTVRSFSRTVERPLADRPTKCSAENFYAEVKAATEIFAGADHNEKVAAWEEDPGRFKWLSDANGILRFVSQAASFSVWADSMRPIKV